MTLDGKNNKQMYNPDAIFIDMYR